MDPRKLGRSNIKISPIGLGCYAIGGTFKIENGKPWGWSEVEDAESIRAIHAGLELGINFLDTAQAYGCGHSETVIGKAIKGRRDKVVLATKFGKQIDEVNKQVLGSSIAPADIKQGCEDSLRRFGTDYIDLFQWHESSGALEDVPAVIAVLEELVAEGKIRYYGWSTDDPERVRAFAQYKNCVAVQNRMHVFDTPTELLALCDELNLASINRGPLMMGILTGKFNADSKFDEEDVRHSLRFDFSQGRLSEILAKVESIREILTADGRTMAQGALGWILAKSNRTIPIPGFKNVKQVEQNAGVLDFGPLAETQIKELDALIQITE